MSERQCRKCNLHKHLSLFSKNGRRSDGYCVWCKTCSSIWHKEWRSKNEASLKQKSSAYYEANREIVRQRQSLYREENSEKISKHYADRYAENPSYFHEKSKVYASKNKEKVKRYAGIWRSRNRSTVNFHAAMRRAAQRKATPCWASASAIRAIFQQAAKITESSGVSHDVDHIVPITPPLVQSLDRGNPHHKKSFIGPLIPVVQGLHCESNLQIITEKQNLTKSNLFWPDMPNIKI